MPVRFPLKESGRLRGLISAGAAPNVNIVQVGLCPPPRVDVLIHLAVGASSPVADASALALNS